MEVRLSMLQLRALGIHVQIAHWRSRQVRMHPTLFCAPVTMLVCRPQARKRTSPTRRYTDRRDLQASGNDRYALHYVYMTERARRWCIIP